MELGTVEADAFSLPVVRRSSWQRWPISRLMLPAAFSAHEFPASGRRRRIRTNVDKGAPRHRSYGSGDSRGMHG